MDEQAVNLLRAVSTLVSFLVFVGIVLWAYSGRNKRNFEEAANLPFQEEPTIINQVVEGHHG